MVTATLCAPAGPLGVMAVIDVSDTTTKLVASTPPTFTIVVPVKFAPVIVITVPPRVDPELGLTLVIVGAGTT